MRTKAAVLVETGKLLEIAELEIPALKPGQVLVKISYSGACHTQVLEIRGLRGEDRFLPHCLGHEATGTVLEVGVGVTRIKPGDDVILTWIKGTGADVPSTVYKWNGQDVSSGAVTTFSRYSVVSENRIIKLPPTFSMKKGILMGCAVPTGFGAVFNVARPKSGNSLMVIGVGGVGLCALAAAAIAGCNPVIAVDTVARKLELAAKSGATHLIDSSKTDPIEAVSELHPCGVDFVIEATGIPDVMASSLSYLRPRGGLAVIVGNAPHGRKFSLDPMDLIVGKRILGTWGGDCRPALDYPKFMKIIASSNLYLESLISSPYSLDRINDAIGDLEAGSIGRPLIDMSM